jgi:hypothetical protein
MSQCNGGLVYLNGQLLYHYIYNGAGVQIPAGSVIVSPTGQYEVSASTFNALPA